MSAMTAADTPQPGSSNDRAFKQRVLSGLKWTASMRLLSQAASWLVTLVVIRLLAPSDYGLLALAQLLIGLATLLNQIGLTPALIQARSMPEHILRSVFGYVLASNAILYVAVYLAAPRFAQAYGAPELVPVIRILGLQLLIGGLGAVPTAIATRDMAFKHLSVIGLVATVVGSGLSLVIAVLDGGVWALVSASLGSALCQTIGIFVVTRFWMRPSLATAGMRSLFSFGAWTSGGRLAWYFAESADELIIGKAFGSAILGSYNVAKNLASLPMFRVMDIVNQVTFPAYSRLEGDRAKALSYFLKSVWLGMLLFCPICWGFAAVSPLFTKVIMGTQWRDATFALHLLALSIPLQALSSLLTPVVQALGRPDLTFRNSLARLVLYPLVAFLAIPYGIDAVVVALVAVRIVTLFMFMHIAQRVFPLTIRALWQSSSAPVIAGAAMYALVSLLCQRGAGFIEAHWLLGLACGVGALVYVALLFLLAPHTIAEFKSTMRS